MSDLVDFFDWKKQLENFKAKAAEFKSAYDYLLANPNVFNTPELQAERNRLVSAGNIIKGTIEKTAAAIDSANAALKKAGSFFGLDGLGFLPIAVPIAFVAASVAAIAYWLTDYNRLRDKVYDDLIESGKTSEEAAKILSTIKAPPTISSGIFSSVLPYIVLGGIAWVIYNGRK